MATRMQQRRGTASQWTTSDPILAAGEIGFESDTNKFKIGDGVNLWSDVPYFVSSDDIAGELEGFATETYVSDAVSALVGDAPAILNTLEELASAIGNDADFVTNTGQALADLGTANNVQATDIANINQSLQSQNTALISLGSVATSLQNSVAGKLDSSVAASTYAPLSNATLSGTVSLPGTTSIGDVSSTEIGYVNGVTSAIQTQINDKAPTANPTFTGTVAGVTKTHVGLGNVDNTSDASKPVSTATQTALDAKAALAGATFTGAVVIEGNLSVTGTTTTINAADLAVSDPLIYLSSEQYTTDSVDMGFLAAYGTVGGTEENHLHSGLVRDNSDSKKWKLISNVPHPIANSVNFTDADRDTLVVGNLEAEAVVFADGVQTKQGVPSLTGINQQSGSYTADLSDRDKLVEVSSATGVTITIPTNGSVAYPVGTSFDILQTGAGQVTIAGAAGVTVNSTPGLKLRTQWSSATLFKRAENTWVVFGDLTA